MSRFTIWIAQPKQWPFMRMFVEVGRALKWSLESLGHEVQFDPGRGTHVENPLPFPGGRSFGRSIILGGHFLFDMPLPEDAILYNLEQVPFSPGSTPGSVSGAVMDEWLCSDGIRLLRRHTVWDYSATNISRLKLLGVEDIHHCRVGYAPVLSHLEPDPRQDIDVLFYGSIASGTRRMRVLEQIDKMRVRDAGGRAKPVVWQGLSGVFGEERDRKIARSKVVINIHANDPEVAPAVFEIVRCAHLFANQKCVVTEAGGHDPELEALAAAGAAYVPYEGLAETCVQLVDEGPGSGGQVNGVAMTAAEARRDIAERGFRAFSAISQVEEVRRALEESR